MPRLKAFLISRTGFILFQSLFIISEIFIFYPCMLGSSNNVRKEGYMHEPVLRNIENNVVVQMKQPKQNNENYPGETVHISLQSSEIGRAGNADTIDTKSKLLDRMQQKKHSPYDLENRVQKHGFQVSGKVNSRPGKIYKADWDSLDSRPLPRWYDEAKIGIFIHWGVYSVPSFVEVGQGGLAEWFWYYLAENGHDSTHNIANFRSVRRYMANNYAHDFRYTDFAPMFKAEFFNPAEWAKLFEESGAKYVVLTSKHHEGYTLWGSEHSWNWNSEDVGPHRDLLGELAAAVREKGIKFGVYHSLYEWFNPHYLEDKRHKFKTQNYVKEKLMPELTELVKKYKPEILWGDGDWEATSEYFNTTKFMAWLYNESPVKNTVVINDRWGKDARCRHGGFMTCDDRYNPGTIQPRKWENCMTIDKESWGYRRNAQEQDYFTMEELTETLAKTVSCGGNLLMNIGPTSDGRIIPLYQERLKQFGDWLKINGEAIYGSKPWIAQQDILNPQVWYTSKSNGNGNPIVYAIVLELPYSGSLELGVPKPSQDTLVTWLGYQEGDIKWTVSGNNIIIEIPKVYPHQLPCQWAWVFKIQNLK
ncbi:alpha-L-fucosidase isoform X2 [Octopus bimaculoides]|uniref:alpha-L-fucosidase n=1 Tax=Octopus bimaculoides TaxID=37653 RepID=A0A0L8GM24_OCTBM|nr:alpha-L-fucosidase isoform X2 [Octopus bimaculoides]|eukprot:XP_014779792.1 PREDICTED: alpha-L-fucosidase-like [Octopus bimaculoides]